MAQRKDIKLAADIGGTFTDIVLETGPPLAQLQSADDDGRHRNLAFSKASGSCFRKRRSLPADVDVFIHGTTLATNALIERKGAKTAFITTEGFPRYDRDRDMKSASTTMI